MGDFPRKADGRRIFTVKFKRGVVQQILKGEKTLAEMSRELDIQPTVIRQWKRRVETGAATAVAADEDAYRPVACAQRRPGSRSLSAAWGASRWRSRSCRRPRRS